MAQTVKLKRSAVSGNVPTTSDLALGEIAINTYDGNIFIKKNDGSESIVTFSAGGNAGSIEEDSFTGNGNTTAFTISTAPSTEENLLVFIDAAFQNRDSFTVSGTTVTFDTAPDNGSSVRIYHVIPGSVDDGILTVAKFAASAIVTEAEGISSNDNDTTIPTSAAVKDYVDTQVATVDTLPEVLANGNTTGGTDIAVSTGDDITFADSSKAIFGAGSDLQIYHDGSNSWISETGTGSLITGADNYYLRNAAGTESKIDAISNGAVTLYYDNTAVLATTADGISVTSEVEASEFIGDLRGAVLFKAQAGEALAKGDVVYISGISGNTTVVSKADADDANKMPAFGIAAAAATANASVDIYTGGILGSLNTSSFSVGDELFVSTTAGALTATAPTGETALLQKIAKVTRSDASAGSIFIIGAGRTNAVPNLDQDQFFLGNASNQAVAVDFSDAVEALSINNVVEDTTPQLGGTLDTNGNLIEFGDSSGATDDRLKFGASGDLQIYHSGGSSFIDEVGAGDLYIRGSSKIELKTSNGAETYAQFNENGSVKLYYDSAAKLATTSTGIDVTGEVLADSLDIDGNGDISGNLTLGGYLAGPATFTIDPAAVGDNTGTVVIAGNLQVDGTTTTINSTTLTVDDKLITLASGAANAAAANGAGIEVDITGSTNPSLTYDGTNDEWDFNKDINVTGTVVADGLTVDGDIAVNDSSPMLTLTDTDGTNQLGRIYQAGATLNINSRDNTSFGAIDLVASNGSQTNNRLTINSGGDISFYEDTGTTTKLFWDASAESLGIGTTSPSAKLHINVGTTTDNLSSVLIEGSDAGSATAPDLTFYRNSASPANSDNMGSIWFYGNNDAAQQTLYAGIYGEIDSVTDGSEGGNLVFVNTNGAAVNTSMLIDSSGKVGIGETNVDAKLHLTTASAGLINQKFESVGSAAWRIGIPASQTYFAFDNANDTLSSPKVVINSSGNVGIGTTSPTGITNGKILHMYNSSTGSGTHSQITLTGGNGHTDLLLASGDDTNGGDPVISSTTNHAIRFGHSTNSTFSGFDEHMRITDGGNVGVGNTNPSAKFQVEEYGIDTTETSTTATTQVAIHTFAAATFRSARFTIQVTNSTDSTYHLTEILMIHDGTTPSITEYGTIFTGAAAEATFDADISSGNVRLLATPASTDTMEFKVVSHSITT